MRKHLFLGVVAALGLCSSSAWATRTNFIAHLADDDSQTGASGEASFTYDDTTKTLCGKVTYSNLTGTPAEFELNASGTDGDVTLAIAPASLTSPFTFSKVLTADQATKTISAEVPYVNLLTSTFPNRMNGEINGVLEAPEDGVGTDACPVADAGTDASTGTTTTTPSSSTSSSSSSGSDTTGSTSTVDAGTSSSSSSGGCATVGDTNAASGIGLATIAGMGLALVMRGRRRRR